MKQQYANTRNALIRYITVQYNVMNTVGILDTIGIISSDNRIRNANPPSFDIGSFIDAVTSDKYGSPIFVFLSQPAILIRICIDFNAI